MHPESPWCDVAIEMHKVSPLDTLKQILIRCKELSEHVYDTFRHFCQTQEYHENVWLLLMTLKNVIQEKDELRYFNSLLKHYTKDLKASMFAQFSGAWRLSLLKTKHRISLWVAELQCKLNSQPHCVSTIKMKASNGKEWDPVCWDGNTWEDSDEAGNIEPLNTHESSSPVKASSPNPVEAASPSKSEEINPELPEQSVMASSEEMSLKDTADAP